MKKLIALVLVTASFSSLADYNNCEINNGEIFSCHGWAQSDNVPVLQDGAYNDCDISNGQIFSCHGWTQAENVPVLQSDGHYDSCSIDNGQVFSCHGWYQGDAIIEQ